MTARRTDGHREVMIATKLGMAIRFAEEEVRPMGRGAAGVRGIEVEDDDQVIAADVVQEGAQILTVTERGFGKRTPLEEYRLQGRAGKGIIDIKTAGRNGTVVGMLQVRSGDDILIVTTKGKVIRIHADEVSSQGRNTMGVRIIDLDADDRVGSIARVEAETAAPAEATVAARARSAAHPRAARGGRAGARRQGRRRADQGDPRARRRAHAG